MKATQFISTLTYTLEELLELTSDDDTGSELEQKLSANGDSRWVQHGAYGIVESCKKVVDELLVFERGEQTPSDWQLKHLIPGLERALGLYETKISMIDSYYREKLIVQLPESAAYQCGRDFKLVLVQGHIYWQGIGENYEEYGADEGYRAERSGSSAKTTEDAIFLLSVVDGLDWSEAVQNVFMANLPTAHLPTDLSDLLL